MGNIMRMNGSRVIQLTKAKLIARITENEKKHIAAYNQAVKAYKVEALKQLAELTKAAKTGDTSLRLNLTTPVDNRKNYAKIREMFEWDNRDEIELEQQEFNEYVLDETEYARHAQMSNSMYLQVLSDAPTARAVRSKSKK